MWGVGLYPATPHPTGFRVQGSGVWGVWLRGVLWGVGCGVQWVILVFVSKSGDVSRLLAVPKLNAGLGIVFGIYR